jgi:SAM-dependent methyltransferase
MSNLRKTSDRPEAACLSHTQAFSALSSTLARWQSDNPGTLRVLEAGGGSLSHLKFLQPPKITVVDISREQLEKNSTAAEKILGDLHSVDLGAARFDMVVAWDVIEHLENPKLVLNKLLRVARPGGIIVLAWPNPSSLTGFVTKWTPHWFHVFVYKFVFGYPMAGKPGWGPFRTVHHRDISPTNMKRFAREHLATVVYFSVYERSVRDSLYRRSWLLGKTFDAAVASGNRMMRAQLQASDVFMVLETNREGPRNQ